jgi:hypothetical protein
MNEHECLYADTIACGSSRSNRFASRTRAGRTGCRPAPARRTRRRCSAPRAAGPPSPASRGPAENRATTAESRSPDPGTAPSRRNRPSEQVPRPLLPPHLPQIPDRQRPQLRHAPSVRRVVGVRVAVGAGDHTITFAFRRATFRRHRPEQGERHSDQRRQVDLRRSSGPNPTRQHRRSSASSPPPVPYRARLPKWVTFPSRTASKSIPHAFAISAHPSPSPSPSGRAAPGPTTSPALPIDHDRCRHHRSASSPPARQCPRRGLVPEQFDMRHPPVRQAAGTTATAIRRPVRVHVHRIRHVALRGPSHPIGAPTRSDRSTPAPTDGDHCPSRSRANPSGDIASTRPRPPSHSAATERRVRRRPQIPVTHIDRTLRHRPLMPREPPVLPRTPASRVRVNTSPTLFGPGGVPVKMICGFFDGAADTVGSNASNCSSESSCASSVTSTSTVYPRPDPATGPRTPPTRRSSERWLPARSCAGSPHQRRQLRELPLVLEERRQIRANAFRAVFTSCAVCKNFSPSATIPYNSRTSSNAVLPVLPRHREPAPAGSPLPRPSPPATHQGR